jgi:transcriptional regulator with XRE-family HTH domain
MDIPTLGGMTSEPRSRTRDTLPAGPHGARKLAFAGFVRRALETARTSRAWNGSEVARRTGVSRQTINRWVRADWHSDPEPERVVAFCEGLGLNPASAFTLLEWARPAARLPEPAPAVDPDIAALMRRLADPTLTEQELFHIRETVRYLAYRPPRSSDRRTG